MLCFLASRCVSYPALYFLVAHTWFGPQLVVVGVATVTDASGRLMLAQQTRRVTPPLLDGLVVQVCKKSGRQGEVA